MQVEPPAVNAITDDEIRDAWAEERIGSDLAWRATRRKGKEESREAWLADRGAARARVAQILRAREAKP